MQYSQRNHKKYGIYFYSDSTLGLSVLTGNLLEFEILTLPVQQLITTFIACKLELILLFYVQVIFFSKKHKMFNNILVIFLSLPHRKFGNNLQYRHWKVRWNILKLPALVVFGISINCYKSGGYRIILTRSKLWWKVIFYYNVCKSLKWKKSPNARLLAGNTRLWRKSSKRDHARCVIQEKLAQQVSEHYQQNTRRATLPYIFLKFFDEMQRLHFALCYRKVCVCMCACVCVCVCMPSLWTSGKRFEIEPSFFKLLGITPDITYKSFTQIGLQIPRWRTKWRPWNTIIGRNSAIY